jgi:hypothetical protein
MRRPFRRRRPGGTAVIITLVALTLLAIIALALTASMRNERLSARNFMDKTKAALFSEMGNNHALALLKEMCGTTNRFWAVRPGEGYLASGSNHVLDVALPLSSGLGGANDANLNISSFTATNVSAVVSTNVPLSVRWLYVYEDGSVSASPPASYNATNRVTGRYGFWVDTENHRVNLNTAWKRETNSASPLGASTVDLAVLANISEAKADEIHGHVRTNRFFNAPEEVREMDVDFEENKLQTTHFSHDPEVTYWGAPRIVLTTQASQAVGRPFLDILKTDDSDPGRMSAVHPEKLNAVIRQLVDYLGRKDWPVGPPGGDFGSKYFPGLPNPAEASRHQLFQLALHIIDYVRAKESAQDVVQKIAGRRNGENYQYTWTDDVNDLTSLSRAPCITEMAIYEEPAANPITKTYWGEFRLEIHLPENYGLPSLDLGQLSVKVAWWHGWYTYLLDGAGPGEVVAPLTSDNVLIDGTTPGTTLPRGRYAVVTVPVNLRWKEADGRRNEFYLKAYLCTDPLDPGLSYVEEAPMITGYFDGSVGVIPYTVDAPDVPKANITSMEVDDPRVNKHNNDWRRHSPGSAAAAGNSFGGVNSISSLGTPPLSVAAQQDVDGAGRLSGESLFMPAPKGTEDNPLGMVRSVAELGRVFTGGMGGYTAGVPWRTLRFQPSSSTNILPDWVLLDLFAAPRNPADAHDTSRRLVEGTPNVMAGRININSVAAPFETEAAVSLNRNGPMSALLRGAGLPQPSQYTQTVVNIRQGTLASAGKNYSSPALTNTPMVLRGQIAEIRGVADGGEETEGGLGDFVDLTTTQAGVFRVYSVGQSLLQTKDNVLKVTGEQRDCTLFERFVPASGPVKFRVIYHREITF